MKALLTFATASRRSRSLTIGLAVCLIAVLSRAAFALFSHMPSAAAPLANSSNNTAAKDDTAVVTSPDVSLDQTLNASSGEDSISVLRARDQLARLVQASTAASADGGGLAPVPAGLLAAEAALLPSTIDEFTEATFVIETDLGLDVSPTVGNWARSGDTGSGLPGAISLGGAGGGGVGSIAGGAMGPVTDLSAGSGSPGSLDTTLEGVLAADAVGHRPDGRIDVVVPMSDDRSFSGDRERGHSSGSNGNADWNGRADTPPGAGRFGQRRPKTVAVPEPSTLLLMGIGLTGLRMMHRRRTGR